MNPLDVLRELVAAPGPPGGEAPVREVVARYVSELGYEHETDPKGNLIVKLCDGPPRCVVTAHLDELALMVQRVEVDGRIDVIPLGGLHPVKWGEQPVEIHTHADVNPKSKIQKPKSTPPPPPNVRAFESLRTIPAILSFGCMHTGSRSSTAELVRAGGMEWKYTYLFTGLSREELEARGVRPGLRVTLGRSRRIVEEIGDYVASYFLDDRADIVSWLLGLESLKGRELPVWFAATACEEVGGEGAAYILQRTNPEICVALEIGPSVPESPFYPDASPTIWVTDDYASMSADDGMLLAEVCRELDIEPHWQALSRGGSDASCTAASGLNARPITLGFPVENSHGLEIMHRDAPQELARLLVGFLDRALTR